MDLTKGIELIKGEEGCRLKSYRCPAGKWTIGYGSTGDDIIEGLRWTQEQANERLARDISYFAKGLEGLLVKVPTENQFNALLSFVYNEGLARLKNSTLLILFNSGKIQLAADEFLRWDKATVPGKGKVQLPGLTKRRNDERNLFLTT